MLSLGVYPNVGLRDARSKRDDARKLLVQGIDPADHRKAAKASAAGTDSFRLDSPHSTTAVHVSAPLNTALFTASQYSL